MFIGYFHISNIVGRGSRGLRNLFLVPCGKTSDHAYMFSAEANSKSGGGTEADSGELGSIANWANPLDK